MPGRSWKVLFVTGTVASVLLTGCSGGGQSKPVVLIGQPGASAGASPAGLDLRGFNLADAEAKLTADHIGFTEKPLDSVLGIVRRQNWIVCNVVMLNEHYVRLEAARYGCPS